MQRSYVRVTKGLVVSFLAVIFFSYSQVALSDEFITALREYQKCMYLSCEANKIEHNLNDREAADMAFTQCEYERLNYITLFPEDVHEDLLRQLVKAQERFLKERAAKLAWLNKRENS